MNDVDITLEQNALLVRDNIYKFSDRFINSLTKSCLTYSVIEEYETKIKKPFAEFQIW